MKIRYSIIGLVVGLLSFLVFAKNDQMLFYQVSPEKVEAYAKQNLLKDTTEAFKILDKYNAYFFESRFQMTETICGSLKNFPQFQKITNNFIQASWMVHEDTLTDKSGMLTTRVWMGRNALDSLKWYIKNDLKNETYSKTANEFLENLLGIIFPDSMLAHRYALSLFAASLGVCNDSVVNRYVKDVDLKWDDEKIRELLVHRQVDLSDFLVGPHRKSHDKKEDVERVINYFKKYNGRVCSDDRWKIVFENLDTLYSRSLADLLLAAMDRTNNFDDKTPVNWSTKKCGCSHKDELNGEVFGIYPYWYAGDTTKWVDFEGVTRLAYYGLHVADDGSLEMPSGTLAKIYLNDEKNYAFVNEAHRHFVNLDWIVFKDDWKNFDSVNVANVFFDNLSNEIDELLNKKINSTFERVVNAFTFYTREFEYRGDGVTLFFKNYPKTKEATAAFNAFFKNLQKRLSIKNKNVLVNIMMDRVDLAEKSRKMHLDPSKFEDEKGIYSYANFISITSHPKHSTKKHKASVLKDLKNYLLVVIEEPVSRSKRLVLNDLNQQLSGIDRRNVLHSVVPVIWFDNKQWIQLKEDAMYYNDSYYSLGLAPYVTDLESNDSCRVSGNLGMCMIQYFESVDGNNARQGGFTAFICTHRWGFRFINIITFLVAIIVLVSYFASCRVAEYFNKHLAILLGIVVVPSAIMMTLLSRLDPSVTVYRGTFGLIPILLLLLSVITIILLQVYKKNDIPKRKKE